MKRINAAVRDRFGRSSMLRTGALVGAIGLVAVCGAGLWSSLSTTGETEQQVTRVTYVETGAFGFSARVVNNDLYGNATLTQEDTSLLFPAITETIEGSFSYQFSSDPSATRVAHIARIDAVIASGDQWLKTVELVPEASYSAPFTVLFPIDTDEFLALADAIGEQIGIQGSSYDLTIRASVSTTAQTDYGPISERLSRSLTGRLQSATLTWSSEDFEGEPRYGSIQETVITAAVSGGNTTWWAASLALVALLGVYVSWSYARSRPLPLAAVDEEAKKAKRKHEDVIVDVGELPESRGGAPRVTYGSSEVLIRVVSLDELIKVSESLLKPVLHSTERGRHTYRVIDGFTTYEYSSADVSEVADTATPDQHEE